MSVCLVFSGCSESQPTDEAGSFYGEAYNAYAAGDRDRALELVNKAIDKRPMAWAYSLRARIHVDKQEFDKAKEDVAQGLALESGQRELIWLDTELKKPESQRFKGANKQPPSAVK